MSKIVFSLIALLGVTALADTWIDPETNIKWSYHVTDGNAVIGCGYGETAVAQDLQGQIKCPQMLGGNPVTCIGEYAFKDCSFLTSVDIPSKVVSIGESAFSGCRSLTQIVLPDSVERISHYSFSGCSNLKILKIGRSLKTIGASAFDGCSNLNAIHIQNLKSWCEIQPESYYSVSFGCPHKLYLNDVELFDVVIPDGVTKVPCHAFSECESLRSIVVPNTVTNMEYGAFNGCSCLTNVVIPFVGCCPDGREWAEWYGDSKDLSFGAIFSSDRYASGTAMASCVPASLRYVSVVNDKEIPAWSFRFCNGIKSMAIRADAIGTSAFSYCSGLKSVFLYDSITNIKQHAFMGCAGLTRVDIPSSVILIGDSAFGSCYGVEELTIGDGVASIGNSAFAYNTHLRSAMITPSTNQVAIGESAFYGCGELAIVALPASVQSIGYQALKDCMSLKEVKVCRGDGDRIKDLIVKSKSGVDVSRIDFKEVAKVTFDLNGLGRCSDQGELLQLVAFGESPTLPSVLPASGYEFIGWFTERLGGVCVDEKVGIGSDETVFYAHYRYTGVTIRFDANGGDPKSQYLNCSAGASLGMLPTVYRKWHEFLGWFTAKEGGVRISETTPATQDVTFFARWRETNPEFEFDGDVLVGYRGTDVNIVIPDGVATIGDQTFAGMEIESVVFPDSLVSIGNGAFENDYYLDSVVIPDSVETIETRAFKNCTEMTSLRFGAGLKSVDCSAFENCISLEKVEFAEGLESLGVRAFASSIGSMRLRSVSLPASLTSIGEDSFAGCEYITGVTVPTHLKTLRGMFPDSFSKIESVVIPDGVATIVDRMFCDCTMLKKIVIPNSVVSIGDSAFELCESITEMGIPNSVISLGTAAFYGCSKLEDISLSKNLGELRDLTFQCCKKLSSLVIPASVTNLGVKCCSSWWGGAYLEAHIKEANLRGIYFLGDAPTVNSETYAWTSDQLVSYVIKGSKGWYLPGSPTLPPDGWPTCGNARPITYWTPNRFDVTFDGNGGTPESYVAEQITDTTYSLPKTNPTRTGYLFDGWWTEPKAGAQIYWNTRVTATKAHTLYAHWKSLKDGITVIFNPNGGTVDPDEVEYPAGVTYGELPVPTRIGHEFLGWYTSQVGGDVVTEATEVHKENNELYAHWRPITYWIVFDANGGYGVMERQLHTYNESQSLRANQYYLNGFKFAGWAETRGGAVKYGDQKEVENLAEIQGQEVTLYAVWNGANYAVRFDGNGGTGSMENQTFVVGVSQGLAECQYTRTGYAFAGWATTPSGTVAYKDKEDVKNLTMVSGQTVNLYAVWTPIQYWISYDANGGEGVMSDMIAIYDQEVTLAANGFTRTGYRFVGWAASADGEVVYEPGQSVLNLSSRMGIIVTLYAVWTLDQLAVPEVSPADGTVFEGSCLVTLTCSTAGATIYYRVGAQPKATDRFKYVQPFEVSETSVIYAFAKLGERQSETICATLTKGNVLTFAEAVNAVGIDAFELGGSAAWEVIETDDAKFDTACVRSGAIGDNQTSWFKATVQGTGTIRFWWKASCEEDELRDFDHLVFKVDGVEFGRLDGITDWVEMSVPIKMAGSHTLMWAYEKDDGYLEGDDCGWIDGIVWEPQGPVDLMPELGPSADATAVQTALGGSADAKLAENITDVATYGAYREWAMQIGAAEVKASPFAWVSFATDSAALLEKQPTDEDLKIEEFTPSATAGSFDFMVSVKDVTIGDKASEDNLKKLFGLEGAESLAPSDFSTDNVALDFKQPEDGKLKFTATPAVDNAKSFFMKMKVK